MSATIVAVGKDVRGFREGDRVAVESNHKQYFTFKPNSQDIHLLFPNISALIKPVRLPFL
jgi:threonine dehydrogenase-like Zn-dependent dehydrogenase